MNMWYKTVVGSYVNKLDQISSDYIVDLIYSVIVAERRLLLAYRAHCTRYFTVLLDQDHISIHVQAKQITVNMYTLIY